MKVLTAPTIDSRAEQEERDAIAALNQLDGIVVFDAGGNVKNVDLTLAEAADVAMLHLKRLPYLRMLILCNTSIMDEDLVHMERLHDLSILDMFNTQIGNAGLLHIGELTNLEWLNLCHTRVTDSGLDFLSGLYNLKWVSFRGTDVTDEGIERLKQALPSVSIPD